LWSLHQTVSTSDVPVVTRRHTRVGIRCPPDVLSSITLLADGDGELTCESKDLSVALPVRVRRASARERLSSYREPASRNPQAMNAKTCLKSHSRALFRLLPIRAPRQAVLRTSSWLAPCSHQQVLRPPGAQDAQCVQPMSATQSNCVHPHLVCSWLALATFVAGTPHGD
jgi:hypothetical protein